MSFEKEIIILRDVDNDDEKIRFRKRSISCYFTRKRKTSIGASICTVVNFVGDEGFFYVRETPEEIDTLMGKKGTK